MRLLAAQLKREWEDLSNLPRFDLDALVREAVILSLQRTRAVTRMNHSVTRMEADVFSASAARDQRLASLYLARLFGKRTRLEAKVHAAADELASQRAARKQSDLRIAYLAHANESLRRPDDRLPPKEARESSREQ